MAQCSGSCIILFDVATTGLNKKLDEVCQLAAVSLAHDCEEDIFNAYVLPTCSFHREASKANGFTIKDESLCREGIILPTISLEEMYKTFFEYLKLKTNPGDKLTLVGYKSEKFDMEFLRRDCHKFGIPVAMGRKDLYFADAFHLLKAARNSVLPGINKMSLQSVHHYLYPNSGIDHVCHDAVADVKNLRKILLHPKVPLEQLSQHEFKLSKREARDSSSD